MRVQVCEVAEDDQKYRHAAESIEDVDLLVRRRALVQKCGVEEGVKGHRAASLAIACQGGPPARLQTRLGPSARAFFRAQAWRRLKA